jgi:hypothetical protein
VWEAVGECRVCDIHGQEDFLLFDSLYCEVKYRQFGSSSPNVFVVSFH